ncbi:DUF943 family protein, partial [Winslowiella iniecta]
MTNFRWFFLSIIISGAFIGWHLMQPTEIIDTHRLNNKNSFDIIARHLPITDKGKIQWWEKNKKKLGKENSILLEPNDYRISFWVSSYKVDSGTDQDSDLLCFDNMNAKANCIEKDNQPMTIWYIAEKGQTIFLLNNWKNKYIKYDATGRLD